MRKTKLWLASLLSALLVMAAVPSLLAQQTGKVHGHVNDPLSVPIPDVQVKLMQSGQAKYTFTTDTNGDYTGDNVAPGNYDFILYNKKNQTVDAFNNVKVTAGQTTTQDFDLSRAAYVVRTCGRIITLRLSAGKGGGSEIVEVRTESRPRTRATASGGWRVADMSTAAEA